MWRESRASDSDGTMRSVLSPLRPPAPDVDEQLRNLALTQPGLVLIDGDRISKESHLENYMRCIGAHWTPEDARGRFPDKNYASLAKLRKGDSNPYDNDPENRFKRKDGKGHLREAWRHLKENWEVLDPKSHAFYLQEFWKKLSPPDPEPFGTAIGTYGTFRFIKLKEIVAGDIQFPEDAWAERALKEGWTHGTRPLKDKAVIKSPQDHLTDFFTDYEEELAESGDYEEELAELYGKIIRERRE